MADLTAACPACGAPLEQVFVSRQGRLLCTRPDCAYVAPRPAAWEVKQAGGTRLPGFGGARS